MDDLRAYRDECNSVLSEVAQALSFLSELKSKYLNVSRKTNALHEACENLLEEQVSDTASTVSFISTIFNQATVQMAADKEAVGLSRVHSWYSNCNLPLF